jgi:acetate kinase
MVSALLIVNAGSSSIKFSAFAPANPGNPSLLFKGQLDGIGTRPRLVARDVAGTVLVEKALEPNRVRDHDAAIGAVSEWLRGIGGETRLIAVGHRVVHGGIGFAAPVIIDDDVLAKLEALVPLAPLHQPANLAGIRAVRRNHPNLPQVACFDTAFHRGHPDVADRFALPEALYREGIRRYGFHGLSYEYIVHELPRIVPEIASARVIIAHLGSGASLCAVKDGRSLDSTMGFTALDGLPMGTRCGALDPGVVIHLMRKNNLSADGVEHLLYHDCGLRGLSGFSNDVRDLLESDSAGAKLALNYFVYHVARHIGALAAVLQGVDGIVFTAGIGERSPVLRDRICSRLDWLGLRLDSAANRANGPCITVPDSRVQVWVIPTDEEKMIARHTMGLVRTLEPSMMS